MDFIYVFAAFMDFMQTFGAFFVALAVTLAIVQVFFSYALQVIAEKNELSDSAAFIAWIPILNLYPFVKVGGGNFKTFVFGSIGACVAAVVTVKGMAAMGVDGVNLSLVAAALALLGIAYFARIAMATAERRGLNKWLGLLALVPVANFLIYPYIAFHDGFKPPKKLAMVLGLLLAFGPLPMEIARLEQLNKTTQEIAQTDRGNGVTIGQSLQALQATREVGLLVAMVAGLDPSDPDERSKMIDALDSAQKKLDEHAEAINDEVYQTLQGLLSVQSARLAKTSTDDMHNAAANSPEPSPAVAADPVAKTNVSLESPLQIAEGAPPASR